MKTLITKDKEYWTPDKEVISRTVFGIIWDSGNDATVLSPHKWAIINCSLRDSTGEVRHVESREWRTYLPAIEWPTWEDYDNHAAQEELVKLREESARIRSLMADIRISLDTICRINDKGGPGSRRDVSLEIHSIMDAILRAGVV